MAFDYKNSTAAQAAQHLKYASRQAVYQLRKHYVSDLEMLYKIDYAYLSAKIARLQDELEALETHQETHTQNAESQHPCGFQEV